MGVTLTMTQVASALTDDWVSPRVLTGRLGFAGSEAHLYQALSALLAKGEALRRDTSWGSRYRYEYRRP